MSKPNFENIASDQREGLHLAGCAIQGIGHILFSHAAGSIQEMRSSDVENLYLAIDALGRYVENTAMEIGSQLEMAEKLHGGES